MGEIAEMMLDGTLCEACGSFIDLDGGEGFPRYCSNQCARDRGALHALPNPISTPNPDKVNCPTCRKRVKRVGLAAHMRDTHQENPMTNARQFVAAKFRESDTRSYTYHWEGEPLAPGDLVRVEDRHGDGWKRVIVASVSADEPPFPTKPILGRYEEPKPDTLDLGDDADLDAPFGDR